MAGVLSVRDAIAAYRSALSGNVQQMRGLRADGVILEADVQPGSAIAGKSVSEVTWPPETVLVAVERAGGLLVPRGDLVLRPTDHLSVFGTRNSTMELRRLLGEGRATGGHGRGTSASANALPLAARRAATNGPGHDQRP